LCVDGSLQVEIEAFQRMMRKAEEQIDRNQFYHSLGLLRPEVGF
jgi:hypothetical protein